MCAYMCVTTLSQRLQDSRYPDGDGKKMMRKARNTKILVENASLRRYGGLAVLYHQQMLTFAERL